MSALAVALAGHEARVWFGDTALPSFLPPSSEHDYRFHLTVQLDSNDDLIIYILPHHLL